MEGAGTGPPQNPAEVTIECFEVAVCNDLTAYSPDIEPEHAPPVSAGAQPLSAAPATTAFKASFSGGFKGTVEKKKVTYHQLMYKLVECGYRMSCEAGSLIRSATSLTAESRVSSRIRLLRSPPLLRALHRSRPRRPNQLKRRLGQHPRHPPPPWPLPPQYSRVHGSFRDRTGVKSIPFTCQTRQGLTS